MEELEHFHALQILELGSNRLRKTLANLQELWLGRNRIKTINLCGKTVLSRFLLTPDPVMMSVPLDDHMVHRGHGVFDTSTPP
uniref:Uncharacterized protein n=1 Tax=Oryza punctata TaxID=4537 RepID=A0A0E0L2E0_ORYPU